MILSRHTLRFAKGWQLPPKPWRFLLITALVIGIFFRFANIDRKSYWFDEYMTSSKISGYTSTEWNNKFNGQIISIEDFWQYLRPKPESNVIDAIKLLAKGDSKHTPLYFGMLRLWVDWFGSSVAAIRCLSAVLSLLVFPCLYWLCLELFHSSLVGWVAVALIAVSPFHVLYAQEARPYSLLTVTILLSSAALLRAIRLKTQLSWGLYAASLSLSIYTHTLSVFVAIVHGIYVVATYGVRLNKVVIAYLIATLVGLLTFTPWLYFRVIQEINDPKCWDNGEIIDVPSIPCLQNLRSNSLKA
jgi:uncharacterized membrane protein